MPTKTPRRLSLLVNLIASFTDTPEDVTSVESQVSLWITATAEEQGRKRSIVRRDLVLQNGYRGAGAQTRFATDLLAALRGQPEALMLTLREGDRDVVATALPTDYVPPASVEAAPAPAPVVEEAPVEVEEAPEAPVEETVEVEEAPAPAPAPAPLTASRIWLDRQCNESGLIKRIAAVLAKRDKATDFDDICSDVGEWLAVWGNKGTFDTILEEKGTVPFSWLVRAVERKRTSTTYKTAQDALARQRGARTQHEINKRVELGSDDYVAPESLVAGDPRVVWQRGDDEQEWSHVIVDDAPTPEDALGDAQEWDHMVAEGREIIKAAYRGAVERYTAVYDALMEGAETEEIRVLDTRIQGVECSEGRATTLKSKIRAALREGATTRDDVEATLALLRAEPWSTKGEIKDHLRDESGTVVDEPRWNRLLAYLESHSLVKAGWGDTYALDEE